MVEIGVETCVGNVAQSLPSKYWVLPHSGTWSENTSNTAKKEWRPSIFGYECVGLLI